MEAIKREPRILKSEKIQKELSDKMAEMEASSDEGEME